MASSTNTLQTYSFPIEKYSSCSIPIQTRSQSSDLHWDHFSHRDQLFLAIQCRPVSSYASSPVCKIRVLWQEQILEDVDVIALATRNIPNYLPEQKCISFLGRYPALAAKYYNEPTQTLRRFQVRLTKETDYHNVSNLLESFKCPVRLGSASKPNSQNKNSQGSSSSIPSSPSSLYPQNEPLSDLDHGRSASTPSSMIGSSVGGDSRPQTRSSLGEILRSDTEMFGVGGFPPKPTENVWGRGIPLDVNRSAAAASHISSLSLDSLPPLPRPTPARKATVANTVPSLGPDEVPRPMPPPFSVSNPPSDYRPEGFPRDMRGHSSTSLYNQATRNQSSMFQQVFRPEQASNGHIQGHHFHEASNSWDWRSAPSYPHNFAPQRQFSELPSLTHFGLSPEEIHRQRLQAQQAQQALEASYRHPGSSHAPDAFTIPATPPPTSPVLGPESDETAAPATTAKGKGGKKVATTKKNAQRKSDDDNPLLNMKLADMTDENIDELIVECIHDPDFADFLEKVEKNWRRVGIEPFQMFS
ncbi:hypothetical protein BJ508DRAFT_326617 [Ascobolus immersus RN42]|uniref:Uncharacterized protein n=1 Tax=Ascobolus immersus RN42 TaxID=1160509 RepID=A0A3N4I569_ASCIM|nr:hypothetical protein BJ508DRAFT_326617 [Ascobolus immersus RN42]